MKRLHVCLVYNSFTDVGPEEPDDRAGMADLRKMIRHIARTLRSLGHTVTVLSLSHDLFAFQRKLRRLQPDVIFNQYDVGPYAVGRYTVDIPYSRLSNLIRTDGPLGR